MSVLRCILISLLISTVIFQSSFMTVLALADTEIAVHSIEELQVEKESGEEPGNKIVIENKEKSIEEDITSLIAAQVAYKKVETISNIEPTFIVSPFHRIIETSLPTEDISLFEDFLKPQKTVFITGEKNRKIRLNRPAKKEQKVSGTRGTIGVTITTGTIISSPFGTIIDPTEINISSVPDSIRIKANEYNAKKSKKMRKGGKIDENDSINSEVFEFGIPDTHLVFSSPVSISIATPLYSDGIVVDIAVMHSGNTDFNTSGLSISRDTLCNADGSASKPSSQGIVKNGKITFYTCGASRFTINPSGGGAGSNDLRLIIGDCAQTQIYYNNLPQIYTGTPPATGCGGPDSWPVLRIGNTNYGNKFTAWSSATTTGSTIGNTYTATSTMTRTVSGRTYRLIIDWSHTAPNKYLTWSYRVIVPTGNTLPIKFYYGMDSLVAGGDTDDIGYYTNTGSQTIGIYDNVANIISAFRYIDGPIWTGYEASPATTVRNFITNGTNFSNTVQSTSGDLGFGINWDFGTTANITYSGSVEWRLLPYVSGNLVDLIPGIGQPEGPLTTTYLSQLPIIITNAGNLTSSGVHTAILTLPANISGPSSAFVDNGWSCGAQVGSTVTCTKTTTIGPLASETVNIPVTPLPAAGGNTVTFNLVISNPGDSNTSNNTAFASNSVVASALSHAPGGVTGMTFWVKANGPKNCAVAGCTITTWNNSGTLGAPANAITGLGTVTYDPTTSINYNPTLYFNNASLNTNSNLSITTAAASIFTMTKLGTGGIFRIGTQTATNNALDWSTLPTMDRLARYNGTLIYNGANQRGTGAADITTTTRATGGTATNRTNGLQTLTNAAVTTAFIGSSIGIGRIVTSNSVLANVGEVIIYPTELTTANRNKVESYLAIKYGTTLDQTASQNYTLSNNNIAWNGSIAGVYKNDIAGIARDDVSSLNQIQSQSIDNNGDIIVNSVNPIVTNYQSTIWANNGTTTNSFVINDTPLGYERINREWQFQEKNGNMGNIKIAYPVSSLPLGASNPIYMFLDSDGVFASGASIYTGTLNAGNWEFTVSITDMQYMTFGQGSDTLAPTILSVSRASGSLMPIGNFPITVEYNDTGSLINPVSFTGRIYSWDGISAWNTTNIAPTYMTFTSGASTSTGDLTIMNLPFGKYRFDFIIRDNAGNITTQSYTYFVDAIEWSISNYEYDIGTVIPDTTAFGTGVMTIIVKTVGAPFTVKMSGANTLAKGADTINYWNGVEGWGYDSGGSILASIASSVIIAIQGSNINQNGLKNTYTYPIKYGGKMSTEMVAGFYDGSVKMDLVANY